MKVTKLVSLINAVEKSLSQIKAEIAKLAKTEKRADVVKALVAEGISTATAYRYVTGFWPKSKAGRKAVKTSKAEKAFRVVKSLAKGRKAQLALWESVKQLIVSE
jgi:hypothetical protein